MARRFTVAEYDAMLNAGTLLEDTTTELIDRWVVPKDRSETGPGGWRVGTCHCHAVNVLAGLSPAFERHGCYPADPSTDCPAPA